MLRCLLSAGLTLCIGTTSSGAEKILDYRYAPASSFTAICFPYDWQKTVVTGAGSLGYDFGPGPYAQPLTEISFGLKGATLHAEKVSVESPRIPIITAELSDGQLTVHQEAVALVPLSREALTNRFLEGRLLRTGGLNGCRAWAQLPDSIDPAFNSVAWGINRPIRYLVKVPAGGAKLVAIGVCDPYKPKAGMRTQVLRVEGTPDLRIDPVEDDRNNTPRVYLFRARDTDNDGWLRIEAHAAPDGVDPNVIMNVFWVFPSTAHPRPADLIRGKLSHSAEVYWDCGTEQELQARTPRLDAMLGSFPGGPVTPTVLITSRRALQFRRESGMLQCNGQPYLATFPQAVAAHNDGNRWTLEFAPGMRRAALVVANGGTGLIDLRGLADVEKGRDAARSYWQEQSQIPFGSIHLPDSAMQYLFEANIRNLYQIAEFVDGQPQFVPGPSVYRGLWVHDEAWQLMASLMLGDTGTVRRTLEGLLRYQGPDGRVAVMAPNQMNRETPILIFSMIYYARMTGDRAWLDQRWESVQRGMRWLWDLRTTMMRDTLSLAYGLFPPGFSDGGLAGVHPEYGSTYWGMIGLRTAADAALWLGKNDDALLWDGHFVELLHSFGRAAARDMRRDRDENLYLPMQVGDTNATTPPQRANWGILDAQGIGHLFPVDDPLVIGSLRMLRAESREGLPPNTGWLADGLWPFFGTLQAITQLYQHDFSEVYALLYAVANHASPLGTWVEEQLPREKGTKTTGDGSNATASALWIHLMRNLLILERPDDVELLAGIPAKWFARGARLLTNTIPTMRGPCSLSVQIDSDGTRASIVLAPFGRTGDHGTLFLHLSSFRSLGYVFADGKPMPDVLAIPWGSPVRFDMRRK